MKNIYCIIGESGTGKTTVANTLESEYGLKNVQSYTTRPPRTLNESGHIFVSDEEFNRLGKLVAYTEYDGYRYGVTEDQIETNDIYVIDPDGAQELLECYNGFKGQRLIRLKTDQVTRAKRMKARGDTEEAIYGRLNQDKTRFSTIRENLLSYDLVIPNTDLHNTIECIMAFIRCYEAN